MPPAQARVQIPYSLFHGFRSRSSLHPWLPYVTRRNAGSKLGSLRLAISYCFYNKTLITIASYSEERSIYRTLILPTRNISVWRLCGEQRRYVPAPHYAARTSAGSDIFYRPYEGFTPLAMNMSPPQAGAYRFAHQSAGEKCNLSSA